MWLAIQKLIIFQKKEIVECLWNNPVPVITLQQLCTVIPSPASFLIFPEENKDQKNAAKEPQRTKILKKIQWQSCPENIPTMLQNPNNGGSFHTC